MKIKNALPGTVAFVLATGSVFASLFADPTRDYVDISTLNPTCRQISEQACSNSGFYACSVLVSVGGGAAMIKQVFDERTTVCATPKSGESVVPIATINL